MLRLTCSTKLPRKTAGYEYEGERPVHEARMCIITGGDQDPKAVTATSEDPTALSIGMPVACNQAGHDQEATADAEETEKRPVP